MIASLAGTVALAACGGDEKPRTQGPAQATFTVARTTPAVSEPECSSPARVPIEPTARDVRVAGLDGRARQRPRKLEVAREIALSCLRWTSWGRARARAVAVVEELDCNPNCAAGGTSRRRARLVVSGLRRCRGLRYYVRAQLLPVAPGSARALRVFITVPCEG